MQVSPIGVTEISHFRAPYKDAYFAGLGRPVFAPDYAQSAQGYGVYEGVGDDEEGEKLMAMWGQNPWGVDGYGRGGSDRMAGELAGYGRSIYSSRAPSAMEGYGHGGPGDMIWHGSYEGLGVIPAAPPSLDPPLKSLDPFFTVENGITIATPTTASALDTTLAQFGSTDRAFAVADMSGKTITVVFYHGMKEPPPGSEPGPYAPFQEVYMKAANAIGTASAHNMMTLVDKRLAMPTPGKRTIVVTSDPQVVANLTQSGGGYFITRDEIAPALFAQAQQITKTFKKAGFFTGPVGVALGVAAVGGVIYLIMGGGKKRRKAA